MKKYYLIIQGEPHLIYLGKFKSLHEAERNVVPGKWRWVILTKADLLSLARQSETSELKD